MILGKILILCMYECFLCFFKKNVTGANIFLHSDGHVKLGDFGAAIKLKKHQTILGEVNDVMGTVGRSNRTNYRGPS